MANERSAVFHGGAVIFLPRAYLAITKAEANNNDDTSKQAGRW